MMKNNISRIIKKYLSGRFSPETEEKVQKWIIKDHNTTEKEQASLEYWNELDIQADKEAYKAFDRVNKRLEYFQKSGKVLLYSKLRRIAAIFIPLILVGAGYFYYTSAKTDLVEVTVAYGDEKYMLLPDSSEIWLNAGTTIRYPKEFKGNQRTVYLEGEGYFSVKQNKEKPFIVETKQLSVIVLGTKFNVKAYRDDEKVTAALTSGKVEIIADNKVSRILKSNEQLTYNTNSSRINIDEISPEEAVSWMNGQLIFTNLSLNEIIRILHRHFNIPILDNTSIPASKLYTVRFLKGENLDEILDILEDVVGFTYQKQGDNIVLLKKE